MKKGIELKPCPFCGKTKFKIERKSWLAGMYTYSVRCNVCHAQGSTVSGRIMSGPWALCPQTPEWFMTDKILEEKAIEAWNRRADNG